MRTEKVRQVLETGLAHMRKYGWTQHSYKNENNQVCALGAMSVGVASVEPDPCMQGYLFRGAQEKFLAVIGRASIVGWNDQEEMTQQRVEDTFKEAIKAVV